MTDVDTSQPVEAPETPSAPPSPSDRLATMSDTERADWRQTGTVPGTDAPAPDASEADESDTTEAVTNAPPVDAAAASEAGKTLVARKQTAQQRINDLAREKYLLQGELNALRTQHSSSRPAAAVEQQPATPAPASSPSDEGEPTEDDIGDKYPTYAAFVDARIAYRLRLAQEQSQQQQAVWQRQQHESSIATAFAARVAAFKADKPDYDDVTSSPDVMAVAHPYLHRAIAESEHGPAIAYYLGTHVEVCRRLASLPTAAAFDRAFGKLEAQLEGSTPPPASTPNHVSQTPAPPRTLGSRPAVPADEIETAVARKDVGAYLRAANAREIGARR